MVLILLIINFNYFIETYENEKNEYIVKPLKSINTLDFTNTFKKNILDKDIEFHYSNSSIIENPKNKNNYLMNIRCINYKIINNDIVWNNNNKYVSINKCIELNTDFKIINDNLFDNNHNTNGFMVGIEDIRLYNYNK